MDIKHVLSLNPLRPGVRRVPERRGAPPTALGWVDLEGGLVEIGHEGEGFSFDNELPRHQQYLAPYRLADRLVTNGEWLEFIADGGYRRHELWLSDGWARVNAEGWDAPFYWTELDGQWFEHTLNGTWPVNPGLPVEPRQLLRGRGLRHLGRQAAAQRGRVGARRHAERSTGAPDDLGNLADRTTFHPRAAGRRHRWAPADVRRLLGVDLLGLPPLPRLPSRPRAPSGSTTASSCPTRWCSAVAARSPRPATLVPPTATSSRTASRWALSGVRLAEGQVARMSRTHVSVLLEPGSASAALVQDVRRGLGSQPLTLPPKWLYDDEGSRLFDEITRLPEYYPTEAERAILRDRADEIAAAVRRDHPGRARQWHQRQDPAAARRVRRGRSPGPVRAGRRLRGHPARRRRADRRDVRRGDRRGDRRRLHAPPGPPAARRPQAGRVPRRHHRQPLRRGAPRLPRRPRRLLRARRLAAARHRPGQGRRPADRGVRRPRRHHREVRPQRPAGAQPRPRGRLRHRRVHLRAVLGPPPAPDGPPAACGVADGRDHPRCRRSTSTSPAARRSGWRSPRSSPSTASARSWARSPSTWSRTWTDPARRLRGDPRAQGRRPEGSHYAAAVPESHASPPCPL